MLDLMLGPNFALPSSIARALALGVVGLPAASCGNSDQAGEDGGTGGGGGKTFEPAPAIAAACPLVTLADVQASYPAATAGVEYMGADESDHWYRACAWGAFDNRILVAVLGARTEEYLDSLRDRIRTGDPAETTRPLSGLGDDAAYWEDPRFGWRGIRAVSGSHGVDLDDYGSVPPLTEEQMASLVRKVLAAL